MTVGFLDSQCERVLPLTIQITFFNDISISNALLELMEYILDFTNYMSVMLHHEIVRYFHKEWYTNTTLAVFCKSY